MRGFKKIWHTFFYLLRHFAYFQMAVAGRLQLTLAILKPDLVARPAAAKVSECTIEASVYQRVDMSSLFFHHRLCGK